MQTEKKKIKLNKLTDFYTHYRRRFKGSVVTYCNKSGVLQTTKYLNEVTCPQCLKYVTQTQNF